MSKKLFSNVALATALVLPISSYTPLIASAMEASENAPEDPHTATDFAKSEPQFLYDSETDVDFIEVEVSYPENSVTLEYRIIPADYDAEEEILWETYTEPVRFTANSTLEARSFDVDGTSSMIATLNAAEVWPELPEEESEVAVSEDENTSVTEDEVNVSPGEEGLQEGGVEEIDPAPTEEEPEFAEPVEPEDDNGEVDNSVPPSVIEPIEPDTPSQEESNTEPEEEIAPPPAEDEEVPAIDEEDIEEEPNPPQVDESEEKEPDDEKLDGVPVPKPVIQAEDSENDSQVVIEYPDVATYKKYRFTIKGGEKSPVWLDYEGFLTLTENGLLEAQAIDEDGNESEIVSHEITHLSEVKNDFTSKVPTIHLEGDNQKTEVSVVIEYPEDTVTKEYRIDDGEWLSYEAPFVIKENGVLEARGINEESEESQVASVIISSIVTKENTAPMLSLFKKSYLEPMPMMFSMFSLPSSTTETVKLTTDETTEQTQIQKFKLPGMSKFGNVTTNTGNVEVLSVEGDEVTVKISGGERTKQVQTGGTYTPEYTQSETDTRKNTNNTFPETIIKNGVTLSRNGAVTSLQTGGKYTPAETKYVIGQTKEYYTDSQGFTGYLQSYSERVYYESFVHYELWLPWMNSVNPTFGGSVNAKDLQVGQMFSKYGEDYPIYKVQAMNVATNNVVYLSTIRMEFDLKTLYKGNVTKSATDTRTYEYTQNYTGTKVIPESDTRTYQDYFKYELTFDYDTNTAPDITVPSSTQQVSSLVAPFNKLNLQGVAVDAEDDPMELVVSVEGVPELQNIRIPVDGEFNEDIELPSTMTEGEHTVTVYVEDDKGDKSPTDSFTFYLDTTPPEITIGGIEDGKSYQETAIPLVHVTDNISTDVTKEITLNGEPYIPGTAIETQGDYTLVVKATDEVGNASTESRTFTVNKKPVINGSLPDTNIAKFEETTIDLAPLFNNPQSSELTFEVEVADTEVAEAVINGSILTITGLKQGSTTLNVKAKNATSTSAVLPMTLIVDNAAPVIAFDEDTWSLVGDGDQLLVTGQVTDVDKDAQSITGTLSDVTATASIPETADETDPWEMTFDTSVLSVGVYNPISVKTTDSYGASHSVSRTKPVVRVAGAAANYQPVVSQYETDVSAGANEWTESTHQELLDAYTAMQNLAAANTVENQIAASDKVAALVNGTVKSEYESKISGNAFQWLKENLASATENHYTSAGISGVTSSNLLEVRKWSTLHMTDLGMEDFQKTNVSEMVTLANHVQTAESSQSITDWLTVLDYAAVYTASVKEESERLVNEQIFLILDSNPSALTYDLLNGYFQLVATETNITEYQEYLTDMVATKSDTLTLDDITAVVQGVDTVESAQQAVQTDPSHAHMSSYQEVVSLLVEGAYKSKHESTFSNVKLLNFVSYPLEQAIADYTGLGVTATEAHIPHYQPNLVSYIKDMGIPNMTVAMIQLVVDATDALLAYQTNPSDTTLDDLIAAVDALDPSSELADQMKEKIKDATLDSINKNPGNVSVGELEEAGVTDVNPDLLPDYQVGLDEYLKDIAPAELTLEDIQLVIDAINAVKRAEANPATETIGNAYPIVNQLQPGTLKDRLLQTLEDLAVSVIASAPESIVADDLAHANIEQVNPELLDKYKEYLVDVLPNISPVTKEDIQNAINEVNTLYDLYLSVMEDPTRSNVESYKSTVEALENGSVKTGYVALFPEISFAHLTTYPQDMQVDSMNWAAIDIVEENFPTYQQYVPRYLTEVGKAEIDKTSYQELVIWLDAYETMKANPVDEAIQSFLQAGEPLDKTTEVYKELSQLANDSLLDSLNKDMSNVTEKQLDQVGVTDVDSSLVGDYQQALEQYRKDLLPESMTVADMQAVIDAINAVKAARELPTTESIGHAYDVVGQLKDGLLKTDLNQQLEDIAVEFVGDNTGTFTEQDLLHANIKGVNAALLDEYRIELQDMYPELLPATKAVIQNAIYIVNELNAAYLAVMADPTRELTVAFHTALTNQLEGALKTKYLALLDEVALAHLLHYPAEVKEDSLTWAEVDFTADNISVYKKYAPTYIEEVGKESLAKDTYQALLDFLDAYVIVSANPTDENIASYLGAGDAIDSSTVFYQDMLAAVHQSILDKLNEDFMQTTLVHLSQLGITDVQADQLDAYRQALDTYKADTAPLSRNQIQSVIHALNSVQLSSSNPTPDSLDDAYTKVGVLTDGALKNELTESLVSQAVQYIVANPSSVTVKDFEHAAIQNVNADLIEPYRHYLEDVLANNSEPVSKDDIQSFVNEINTFLRLIEDFTAVPDRMNLDALIDTITNLEEGVYKESFAVQISQYAMRHINYAPGEQDGTTYTWASVTHLIENMVSYNERLPLYAEDVATLTEDDVATFITAINDFEQAMIQTEAAYVAAAVTSINKLEDGALKPILLDELSVKVLDSVNGNIENVTNEDLSQAGITDLVDENAEEYQGALKDYQDQLDRDLTLEEVQMIIDIINKVVKAEKDPTPDNLLDAKTAVDQLENGALKDDLIERVQNAATDYVNENMDAVTTDDLEMTGATNVQPDVLDQYKEHMESHTPLTKEEVQSFIDEVNQLHALLEQFNAEPSRIHFDALIDVITNLAESTFKDSYVNQIDKYALLHINFVPAEQDTITYNWAELSHSESNMVSYNEYLSQYADDISTINAEDMKKFITAIDEFVVAIDITVAENVAKAVSAVNELEDGQLKALLLSKLTGQVLDSINKDFGNVTIEDLSQAGIDNLVDENEEEYQGALKDYQEQLDRDLTPDEIQSIIDIINKVVAAEQNPTPDSLSEAKEAVEQLEDGPLKDDLLDRIENAAADYVDQNLDSVTVEDLEMTGATDVDSELLDQYIEAMEKYQPLTKEKIQAVINVMNQLDVTVREMTPEEIDRFVELVGDIESSNLHIELVNITESLHTMIAFEKVGTQVAKDKMAGALEFVTLSIRSYLMEMERAVSGLHTALQGPTDAIIDEAIAEIGKLREGNFKTRMLSVIGEAYIDFVQKYPGKVTDKELVKAGFERVNPDFIEEYRKGFESLTNEKGTLDRETIQLIIDVVNEVEDARSKKTVSQAVKAKEWVEKLPESEWKSEKLKEINQMIVQFTPVPSPSPSPDHNDSAAEEQPTKPTEDKPEEEKPSTDADKFPTDSKPVHVEGVETDKGFEFEVSSDMMESIINQKSESVNFVQGDSVTINVPLGAIDFEKLQNELGKYGLLIQLIKIDAKNYQLVVKALTEEGEREIRNFEKHLKVSLKEDKRITALAVASTQPVGKPAPFTSVVLRKDGDALTAVPHTYVDDRFTIRTTRAGHFIVKKQYIHFDDIQKMYSKDDIEELAARHIVFGTTENTYSPNAKITRSQLAAMIARAMDLQPTKETHFQDIQGKWYEDDVQALYEAGIIQGKDATTFDPAGYVTRQQAAAMMNRALDYAGASVDQDVSLSFTDSHRISEYARHDVGVLQTLNIISGKEDGRFDPHGYLTRAQMAKVLSGTLRYASFM